MPNNIPKVNEAWIKQNDYAKQQIADNPQWFFNNDSNRIIDGANDSKYFKNAYVELNALQNPTFRADYLADSQTWYDRLGNVTGKVLGKTANDLLGVAAFLGGAAMAGWALSTGYKPKEGIGNYLFDTVLNNGLSNYVADIDKKLSQDLPYYTSSITQKNKQDSFGKYLMSGEGIGDFLFNDVIGEGVPFAASAWITGLGMGAVAEELGAKGLSSLLFKSIAGDAPELSTAQKTIAKTAEYIGLNNIPKTTAAAFNTFIESSFESHNTYSQMMEKKDKYGNPLYTKDQARHAALVDFGLNMLTLPLTEFEYNGMFGSAGKIESGVSKSLKDAALAEKGSKFSKYLPSLGTVWDYGKAMIKEGGQEGLQQAFQDATSNNPDAGFLDAAALSVNTFIKNFASNPDYLDQELSGGLMGIPFMIMEKINKNQNEQMKTAYRKDIYDNNVQDYFKDKRNEKITELSMFAHLQSKKEEARAKGNETLANYYDKMQFSNMAFAMFESDLGDRLVDQLKAAGQRTDEEWAAMGVASAVDEEGNKITPKEKSEQLIKEAKRLQSLYNDIKTIYPTSIANSHIIHGTLFRLANTQNFIKNEIAKAKLDRSKILTNTTSSISDSIRNDLYELSTLDKTHKYLTSLTENKANEKDYSNQTKEIKNRIDLLTKKLTDYANNPSYVEQGENGELNVKHDNADASAIKDILAGKKNVTHFESDPMQSKVLDMYNYHIHSLESEFEDIRRQFADLANSTANQKKLVNSVVKSQKEAIDKVIKKDQENDKAKKNEAIKKASELKPNIVIDSHAVNEGETVQKLVHDKTQPIIHYDLLNTEVDDKGNRKFTIRDKVTNATAIVDEYGEDASYFITGEHSSIAGTDKNLVVPFQYSTLLKFKDNSPQGSKINQVLQKILGREDYRDFISYFVTDKFSIANKQNGLQYKNLKGRHPDLKLMYSQGVDIVMEITDPETGQKYSLFHAMDPDNYAIKNGDTLIPINFKDLSFEDFKKYFAFDKNASAPVTEADWETFKNEWIRMKEFKDAVTAWFNTQQSQLELSSFKLVDLPHSYLSYVPICSLDFTNEPTDHTINDNDLFNQNPVVYYSNPSATTNQILTESPLPGNLTMPSRKDGTTPYFGLATFPNGQNIWVQLIPRKLSKTEFTKLFEDITNINNELSKLNSANDLDKAKNLVDSLNMFIALPHGFYFDFNLLTNSSKTEYSLGFKFAYKGAVGEQSVNFQLRPSKEITSTKDLLDEINSHILGDKAPTIFRAGLSELDENNFRITIPLNIEKSDKNLALFSAKTHDNVAKEWNIRFMPNTDIVIADMDMGNRNPEEDLPQGTNDDVPEEDNIPTLDLSGLKPKQAETKTSNELQSKKADIERRRQEELNIFPNSQVQETVFHNTTTDFEEFKVGKDGAIHFGDKEAARQRTKNVAGEKFTKEAKINIENLVEGVDSLDFGTPANASKKEKAIFIELLKKADNETKEHILALYKNGKITLEQANKLIDEGWSLQKIYKELFNADGYYYINQAENKGSKSYVVFHPNQIKVVNKINAKYDAELAALEKSGDNVTNFEKSQANINHLMDLYYKLTGGIELNADELKLVNDNIDLISGFADDENSGDDDLPPFKIGELESSETEFKDIKEYLANVLPQVDLKIVNEVIDRTVKNGVPLGTVINNSLIVNKYADKSVVYHEAFHFVYRNLLSRAELSQYYSLAKKAGNFTHGKMTDEINRLISQRPALAKKSRSTLENLVLEEYLADRFADWKVNKANEKVGFFNRLFNLLQRFIDSITSPSIDGLFRKIDRGAFRRSKILGVFNGVEAPFKLLHGKTVDETVELINTIASKTVLSGKDPLEFINEYIGGMQTMYSPLNKRNKAILENIKGNETKANYILAQRMFWNNQSNINLIKEQVIKELRERRYNPIDEEYEMGQEEQGKEYEKPAYEFDPKFGLSAELRQYLSTVLEPYEDIVGNKLERAVNIDNVFSKLLRFVSHLDEGEVMPEIKRLSSHDKVMKALYNKLVNDTGYSPETPNGVGNNMGMLKRLISGITEFTSYEYSTIVIKDGKAMLISPNKGSVDVSMLNGWINEFVTNTEKRLQDPVYRNSIVADFNNLVTKFNSPENTGLQIKDYRYNKFTKGNTAIKTFANIGVTLEDGFANNPDNYAKIVEVASAIAQSLKNTTNIYTDEESGVSQRMIELSQLNAPYSPNYVINSYRDSDNKARYSYGKKSALTRDLADLKSKMTERGSIGYIKDMMKDPYWALNPLFNNGIEDENESIKYIQTVMKHMQISYAGDISLSDANTMATYKDLTNHLFVIAAMNMYLAYKQDSNTSNLKIAAFIPSVLSDSNHTYAVKMPVNSHYVNGSITPKAMDMLYGVFKQEFNRIHTKRSGYATKDYVMFPQFNAFDGLKGATIETLDSYKGIITDKLNEIFNAETNNLLSYLTRNMIDSYVTQSETAKEQYNNELDLVGNFILNDFINSTIFNQLFKGDVAEFKFSYEDAIKKKEDVAAVVFSKREKRTGAQHGGYGNGDLTIIFSNDIAMYINKDTLEMVDDIGLIPESEKDKWDLVKAVADSHVISNLDSLKYQLEQKGEYTATTFDVIERLKNPPIVNGKPVFPTKKELVEAQIDLVPMKDVTAGIADNGKQIFGKQTNFILTKQLCANWDGQQWVPKAGREFYFHAMNMMDSMTSKKDDGSQEHLRVKIMPKSASKAYFIQHVSTEDIKNGKVNSTDYIKIPNKYDGMQLLNKTKSIDKVKLSTQMVAILPSQLSDNNNHLRNAFNDSLSNLRSELFKFNLNQIFTEAGVLKEDLTDFASNLQDTLMNSTPDSQIYELLQTAEGKLKYNLNLPHIIDKVESLYNAHFRSAFGITLPGRITTLIPAVHLPIICLANNDQSVVLQSHTQDRYTKYYDTNGKLKSKYKTRQLKVHNQGNSNAYGEIMLTAKTAERLKLKTGDSVPLELMKFLGFRTPLQGLQSIGYFKLVDYLPEEYGDACAAPNQLVWLMGSDFDADKLYLHNYDFYFKGGEAIKYGDETTDEDKWAAYKHWWFNNNIIDDVQHKYNELLYNDSRYKELKRKIGIMTEQINLTMGYLKDTPKEDRENYHLFKTTLREHRALRREFRTELKSVMNEAQTNAMKSMSLPSTFEEWAVNKPESMGALYNKFLDSAFKIAESNDTKASMKKPVVDAPIVDIVNELKNSIPDNLFVPKFFMPYSFMGKLKVLDDNKMAKSLVGVGASNNSAVAYISGNRVQLKKDWTMNMGNKTHDSFFTNYIDMVNAQNFNSTLLTVIVDNANNPNASILNLSAPVVSALYTLRGLGINDNILVKASMQPVIAQLTAEFTKFLPDTKTAIFKRLGTELFTNVDKIAKYLNFKYNSYTLANLPDAELFNSNLEDSYRFSNTEKLSVDDFINSDESIYGGNENKQEVAKMYFKTLVTQLQVLNMFQSGIKISDSVFKVSRLLSLNKTNGKTFSSIYKILQAATDLNVSDITGVDTPRSAKEEDMAFNMRNTIEGDKNISTALSTLGNQYNSAGSLFIKSTDAYNSIFNALSTHMFMKSEDIEKMANNLLAYLSVMAYEKHTNRDANSFNKYLYPVMMEEYNKEYGANEKTIAEEFRILRDTLADPTFRHNMLVKYLEVQTPFSKNNNTAMELLNVKLSNNLSSATREMFSIAFNELWFSKDDVVKRWTRKVLGYFIAKDNLLFKGKNFLRYLNPEAFKTYSDSQKLANETLNNSNATADDYIRVFGKTQYELASEFIENTISNNDNNSKLMGKVVTDKLVDDKGSILWDMVDSGSAKTFTLQVPNIYNGVKKSLFPINVYENSYDVSFPEFLIENLGDAIESFNVPYKKIYENIDYEKGLVQVKYQKLDTFTLRNQSIYHNTPDENRKLSAKVASVTPITAYDSILGGVVYDDYEDYVPQEQPLEPTNNTDDDVEDDSYVPDDSDVTTSAFGDLLKNFKEKEVSSQPEITQDMLDKIKEIDPESYAIWDTLSEYDKQSIIDYIKTCI